MVSVILNYRRNMLILMFIILFIGSFHSQTRSLCSEWWVEQQRYCDLSFQIIRREEAPPLWYIHLQNLCKGLKAIVNDGMKMHMIYQLLSFAAMVWFYLLGKAVMTLINKGVKPSEFVWNWSGDVAQSGVEINLHVVIDRVDPSIEIFSPVSQNDTALIGIEFKTMNYELLKAIDRHNTERNINIYIEPENEQTVVQQPDLSTREPGGRSPKSKNHFDSNIEWEMKIFYNTLSEKDKRRYAGIEAMKLGHGGRVYIAKLFGCSRKTVSKGIRELFELPADSGYEKRIRKPGGGRKPYWMSHDESLDDAFLDVVKLNTAGNPMNEKVLWTNLTHIEIAEKLLKEYPIPVSTKIVRQLLEGHRFHRRKALKNQTMKSVDNRNVQFENIARLRSEFTLAGDPIVSMDSKKKEDLVLFRAGHLYTQGAIITPDHDFKSYSPGVVNPHGIWDVNKNKGYISIGTSKDTSEFAYDSLKNWWCHQGQYDYPLSTRILILCDGGGSNSSRSYLFKQAIQKLADKTGLEIRIAHYPPYTSKYNPIEHRMFPHVTRACRGVIFYDYEQVRQLMEKSKTRKGLTVKAEIIQKKYEIGLKADDDFKKNMPIIFDEYLPKWNYRAIPTV